MNTSRQHEAIADRLDRLKEKDPAAAAQISGALEQAPLWPSPEPDTAWKNDFTRWLQQQGKIDLLVASGSGTARETTWMVEQLPASTRLVLLERNAAQLAALFRGCPLEQLIADGRLLLATGSDIEPVADRIIGLIDARRPPAIALYDQLSTDPDSREFYDRVLRHVREQVKINVFNVNTLLHHGPMWQFNSLKNMPRLLTNPDIKSLFGRFAGRPAVVVGAGPSLNAALPFLARNARKCVILTAATALRPLRAAGIRPDLVVAVDGSHKTAPQFKTKCEDLFLACSSMAYPPALPLFRGLFCGKMDANPIDHWLIHNGIDKADWAAGGTVTTSALDLAIKMGCDPVISVGFDLSFRDDGTTHANQTMYQGARLDPTMLIKVPGNYRQQVLTTEQFKVYLDLLNMFLKQKKQTHFINATTGGAKIEGMELLHPEVLDGIEAPQTAAYDTIINIHQTYQRPDLGVFHDKLAAAAELFTEVISGNQQAARICNRLIMILKSPCREDEQTVRDYLKQLEKIDRHFSEMREASLLLDMSLWPSNFTANMQQEEGDTPAVTAIETNRRSRETYEQIVGAATWTRQLILENVSSLRRMIDEIQPTADAAKSA